MDSREAYEVIRCAVEADSNKRIVKSFYDKRHFGSFIVSFEENGEGKSIVNDRGFVFVAGGFQGDGDCLASVPSLYDADPQSLLQGLKL